MPDVSDTAPLGREEPPAKRKLPGLTGMVAAGLVVLACAVLAAQVWAWSGGHPGPGAGMVTGHGAAAVVAVSAQHVVDRRRGRWARVCAALVAAVALTVLLAFWWS